MKYPENIKTENGVEDGLMKAMADSEFDKQFVKHLEAHLNKIGLETDFNQSQKIALAGYIFIEIVDNLVQGGDYPEDASDKIRPELVLKALDDASNFNKVVKKEDISDDL